MTANAPLTAATPWALARRAERMNPSVIREILKIAERPGTISLAGGLPSPGSFPVGAVREATARVLRDAPREALQYAASEGFEPQREWVAAHRAEQSVPVDATQVLITTGSQQGLELAGKVLIDAGSGAAVEAPTHLGALQASALYEPEVIPLPCDADGPLPESLGLAQGARFLYVLPNFQNPSGRCMPKLLQAKQAADLHTSGFNQRGGFEVVRDGFLRGHVPTLRARYKAQRDAMRAALEAHMPAGCHWAVPHGGMFFWVELPEGVDATALLPDAVERGMAYVPGAASFPTDPQRNTLRLSCATLAAPEIERGVALLAQALKASLARPA